MSSCHQALPIAPFDLRPIPIVSRQNNLGKFLKALQRLADEFGVAVVVSNQVRDMRKRARVITTSQLHYLRA